MDISGIHEDHGMLGGKVLFELELSSEGEYFVLDAPSLGCAFCEPYDGEHLWFWAQAPLEDVIRDKWYWNSVASGISRFNDPKNESPSGEELLHIALLRLKEGNTPEFEKRVGFD